MLTPLTQEPNYQPYVYKRTFFEDRHGFDMVLGNVDSLLDGNQNDFETRFQQQSLLVRRQLLQKRSNLPFSKPLHAKNESKINYYSVS